MLCGGGWGEQGENMNISERKQTISSWLIKFRNVTLQLALFFQLMYDILLSSKSLGMGMGLFLKYFLQVKFYHKACSVFPGVAIERLKCIKTQYMAFISLFFVLFTWRYLSLKVGVFSGEKNHYISDKR